MRIEKKSWPEMFQKVLDGDKTFDARIADFECSPGDVLVLREWDPVKAQYTGRSVEKKISYVLKTKDASFWKKEGLDKHGLQILALK